MPIDYIANAERNMRNGTDELTKILQKGMKVVETQHGIVKYMEAMAQVMAEAALASEQATGDFAMNAVHKWTKVVEKRAIELIEKQRATATKQIEKGTVIDQEKPDGA